MLGYLLPSYSLTLGRRFAQVEFVTCLVMVVRRWSIELKDGWSEDRVWTILDKSQSALTMSPPAEIPLVFRQRPSK